MTEQARDWLPYGVLARDAVRTAIETAVADWSQRWFATSGVSVSNSLPCKAEARTDADSSGWRLYCDGVALSSPSWGAQRLVDKALDAAVDRSALTEADSRLIEGFESRLLEDLARTIQRALGLRGAMNEAPQRVRDPFGGSGGVVFRFAENAGVDVISLAVSFSALMPLCRTSLGARDRKPMKLESFSAALASVPVTVVASLGRVEIGLADLQALAPGDVLVLDTALSEPIRLISAADDLVARARLVDAGGEMTLVLN